MSITISRSDLTSTVLSAMTTALPVTVLVGDAEAPQGAGWGTTQPNTPGSTFTPYVVVFPLASQPPPPNQSGSYAVPQEDWRFPYALQNYGVSRAQVEWVADRTRSACEALTHTTVTLGSTTYKVQQAWTTAIGGVSRNDATDAPYYAQVDTLTIWITRETV